MIGPCEQARQHLVVDYTGGPQGVGPITAHCRCGITATADLLEDVDRLVWEHVPEPPVSPAVARAEVAAQVLAGFSDDVFDASAEPYEADEGEDMVVRLTLTLDQAEQLIRSWSE